jgi:hypothetical protein
MSLANFNRIMQATDIVSAVGVEIGLPKVSDPFTINDPQYQRMINLLNIAGNALGEFYPWTRLINKFSLTTIANQTEYDLPLDWDAMIDQTLWRQGGLYPGYPSSPQVWQYFSNIFSGVTLTVLFREQDGKLLIWPSVGAGIPINMEYRSRGWVRVGTGSNVTYKDNVTIGTDYVMHDPLLISRFLKLKFLEALGFDTQSAKDEFNVVLEARSAKDQSAPVLAASSGTVGFRLIDCNNAPETGFGR